MKHMNTENSSRDNYSSARQLSLNYTVNFYDKHNGKSIEHYRGNLDSDTNFHKNVGVISVWTSRQEKDPEKKVAVGGRGLHGGHYSPQLIKP